MNWIKKKIYVLFSPYLSPIKEYNKQKPHSEIFGTKQNALTLNIVIIKGLLVGM